MLHTSLGKYENQNKPIITPNPKRTTFSSHEYYFKTQAEMNSLFEDLPELLANTQDIVNKCEVRLDFETKHYPIFSLKATTNAEEYLKQLCEEKISTRYTKNRIEKIAEIYPTKDPNQLIRERLTYELDIITSKGLTDYFLLVWDFIHWAKNNDIPVGPGRGSGVGSIVLYLIGVTDIEPLRFHLLFERFINPGRLSYPDIDVDICMERRSDVIKYTIQKYGKENVAQIITFGTMKAKMSVRDVGRTLNIPLSKVNHIAKLIPDDLNITIEKALEKSPDLYRLTEQDEETRSIISAAKILQGSIRNTGIHAAGLIVCGEPLVEHIPICIAKDTDMYVTQYSMKPAEQVGMLKIDFLGLKTLTSIKHCVDRIRHSHNIQIQWNDLPLEDQETFELINQGKTVGIFQIEEGGMQDLAQQIHIDHFEEIIALLALYRPGPMEMIPHFIARKWKREPIEYEHPLIEPILKETYGIMVYQEQIMQIAQELSNYSLGEGDILRRAMGKKDAKEMARQRKKFISGCEANNIHADTASSIFNKMEKFAEYGFNKSHAAAYAYITYVTAYLKAHFPAEWLASLMTCDRDDIAKVARFMHEAQQLNISCLPPDINDSTTSFIATSQGIRFALSAIKGVGTQAVEAIMEERNIRPFSDLKDFIQRIDPKRVGKKTIELLIDAGAFDTIGSSRDAQLALLTSGYDSIQQTKREEEKGIFSLFNHEELLAPVAAHHTPQRSKADLLLREKQLLGIFLSGHPLHEHKEMLQPLNPISIPDALALQEEDLFYMAFVIEHVSIKTAAKSKRKFAIITISDTSKQTLELPIWPDIYETHQELWKENSVLFGIFATEKKEDEITITCKWITRIQEISQETLQTVYAKEQQAKRKKTFSFTRNKHPQSITKIYFDLTRMKASHILSISSLMTPPKQKEQTSNTWLSFVRNGKEIAHIEIPRGSLSENNKKQLEKLPSWIQTSQHAL